MKFIVNSFFVIVVLISCALAHAESAYSIEFHQVRYDIFRVQATEDSLQFFWKRPDGRRYSDFRAVKKYFMENRQKLIFATNGGIFAAGYAPLGLYIENGVELRKLNVGNGYGNFFLKPNGVFYVSKKVFGVVRSDQFFKINTNVLYATQSGPMLVTEGLINSRFKKTSTSLFVRSGVGIDQAGNALFVISKEAINFYTFALLFKKQLHCENALYLDGAISKMYLPKVGRDELDGNFAVIIAVGVETVAK